MATLRSIATTVVIALVVGPAPSAAQHVPRVDSGATVRVTATELGLHGEWRTVAGYRSDTLLLAPTKRHDPPVPVPLGAIQHWELLEGRRARTWQGLGIGLLGGAALGAVVGGAMTDGGDGGFGPSRGEVMQLFAVVGAPVGALVGAIVGSRIHSDRWRPLSRASLGTVPRVALGLQLRLGRPAVR